MGFPLKIPRQIFRRSFAAAKIFSPRRDFFAGGEERAARNLIYVGIKLENSSPRRNFFAGGGKFLAGEKIFRRRGNLGGKAEITLLPDEANYG